jgi:cytochrome bd-type quinol oxidase subunit 1
MWNRYRSLKPVLGLGLAFVALWLMRDKPDASARWLAGIGIAAVLVLAYIIEEIVWMTRNQGRPCLNCSRALRVRPFHLHLRCPHCGKMQ